MTAACPYCGSPLKDQGEQPTFSRAAMAVSRKGRTVYLSPRLCDVFTVLWEARPEFVKYPRLVYKVFKREAAGHADPDVLNIRQHMHLLNRRLVPIGLATRGQQHKGFRIEVLPFPVEGSQ